MATIIIWVGGLLLLWTGVAAAICGHGSVRRRQWGEAAGFAGLFCVAAVFAYQVLRLLWPEAR